MALAAEQSRETRRDKLARRYPDVRARSLEICAPLCGDDYGVQSMPDVSPPKWHLAHTSWFFETFVLEKFLPDYRPYHPQFNYLFNSYYKGIGSHHPREARGLLSRPTLPEVLRYREHVDAAMGRFFREAATAVWESTGDILELGLNHEQQHQELLLTDIKHIFGIHPLRPVYRIPEAAASTAAPALGWIDYPEALTAIGKDDEGFSFDNESPRHRLFLDAYRLASRLVTAGEFMEFIADGGYEEPRLWLSDGWDVVLRQGWKAPLYWENRDGWRLMTLGGVRPVNPDEPVVHVSYYEAHAFAHWAGFRLPTEGEWEVAAEALPVRGRFYETGRLHPSPAEPGAGPAQMFGDCWEWTASPYVPYPRFKPHGGDAGEYNGKFMCNQMVLRGGSCATPEGHVRSTYRNFFPPAARWQFSGIRLAEDA